ncbi:MAG: RNA-binding transcriptional accessory protein [SAR324 cluster bacterium]|nr:RNA-binding transcriptional accessory protein [SAR324 cluster bacterium]
METTQRIAQELEIDAAHVKSTVEMLNEGNTLPFIARYRKEATGNLDEIQIGAIQDRWQYLQELEERRESIILSIQTQGKLTPELETKLRASYSKQQLEDLYLPYKPKRRTRAMIAKEKGFEALAELLLTPGCRKADLEAWLTEFNQNQPDPETPMVSQEEALAFARDIVAEKIAEHAESRESIRKLTFRNGIFVSKVKKDWLEKPSKFEMYYDFQEAVRQIPAHRYLALRRGEKENVLRLSLELPEEEALQVLRPLWGSDINAELFPILEEALQDAYRRLIAPSIESEIRLEVRSKAEEISIEMFSKNLRQLLLQAPGGQRFVLGLDPGFRTGTKWAIVDSTGKYVENGVIYPVPPQNKIVEAEKILHQIFEKHPVEIIAVGNGTASREVQSFVQAFLKKVDSKIVSVVVNESGASVYSASEAAREEFPDLDLTVRGAISIARRYQDPLAELVKIDPRSIGVGQYQHDVNSANLQTSLTRTVESCVNFVGADLNTASAKLLTHVAGITASIAQRIVDYRNSHGSFRNRSEILKVDGVGPKTFEQSAGFLRIPSSDNPLDGSAVHPESYPIVSKMARDQGLSVEKLIGNSAAINTISRDRYISDQAGQYTLQDIIEELKKPGRDPRSEHQTVQFNEGIEEIKDLEPGVKLNGVITNITNFGVFVDIGVHQDGLVHVSEMSRKFIKNPMEICSVGQNVVVFVKNVDSSRKRIGLSMLDPKEEKQVTHRKKSQRNTKIKRVSSSPDDFKSTVAKLEEKFNSVSLKKR